MQISAPTIVCCNSAVLNFIGNISSVLKNDSLPILIHTHILVHTHAHTSLHTHTFWRAWLYTEWRERFAIERTALPGLHTGLSQALDLLRFTGELCSCLSFYLGLIHMGIPSPTHLLLS